MDTSEGTSYFDGSSGLQVGGNKLDAQYTLGGEVGRGASGVVFKALNLHTGGVVAVKQVSAITAPERLLNAQSAQLVLSPPFLF